jgi:hypothetical protein
MADRRFRTMLQSRDAVLVIHCLPEVFFPRMTSNMKDSMRLRIRRESPTC